MYLKQSSVHEPFRFIMCVKTAIDGELVMLNSTEKYSNNFEGQSSWLFYLCGWAKRAVPSTASTCMCQPQTTHIWLFCMGNSVPKSLSLDQTATLLTRMPASTCCCFAHFSPCCKLLQESSIRYSAYLPVVSRKLCLKDQSISRFVCRALSNLWFLPRVTCGDNCPNTTI